MHDSHCCYPLNILAASARDSAFRIEIGIIQRVVKVVNGVLVLYYQVLVVLVRVVFLHRGANFWFRACGRGEP